MHLLVTFEFDIRSKDSDSQAGDESCSLYRGAVATFSSRSFDTEILCEQVMCIEKTQPRYKSTYDGHASREYN